MKQSKYYTPSIEEFYIGFECEILGYNYKKRLNESFKKEWDKLIYSLKDFQYLKKENLKNNFRIKYLDKEDIESLGWKYTGNKDDYGFLVFTKNIEVGFNSGNLLTLRYSPVNHGIWIKRQTYGSWGDYVDEFPFYVKNKSELKKLMQQLNINE